MLQQKAGLFTWRAPEEERWLNYLQRNQDPNYMCACIICYNYIRSEMLQQEAGLFNRSRAPAEERLYNYLQRNQDPK